VIAEFEAIDNEKMEQKMNKSKHKAHTGKTKHTVLTEKHFVGLCKGAGLRMSLKGTAREPHRFDMNDKEHGTMPCMMIHAQNP